MFLLSLSKCFSEISSRNRQMEPGQVWLNLIPLFNLVWIIITIIRLADSLRDEFDDRRLDGDGDYGKTLGILYFVFSLTIVCGPVGLVCFIMYWVKVSGYTSTLRETDRAGKGSRRNRKYDDDIDEDDDDRPRRRRRDEDDEER
jgi:hypothetical protein